MKRYWILLSIMVLLLVLSACQDQQEPVIEEPEQEPLPRIVMVTSEGGLGDESFNGMTHEGVLRAASDYEIEVSVMEPSDASVYVSTIEKAASEGANMVIAVGAISSEMLVELGERYPETSFVVVDSDAEGPENVMSLSFKEQEGSFLVGVIAALTTKTNIVGFIGCVEGPTIDKFEYGFRAGVKAINPDAQVIVDYLDCFDDTALGSKTTLSLIDQGVDIVFHAAGESGISVIEAAGSMEIWAIGIDKGQSSLNPEAVLCSMFKRVDYGVYFAI